MSYDLAVWDGEAPASAEEAIAVYADLAEEYLEVDEIVPTAKITGYIEALLQRWPDDDDNAPWASGGTGDASGPVLCVNISPGREDEVVPHAAELATEHGLVLYDLQEDRLLT